MTKSEIYRKKEIIFTKLLVIALVISGLFNGFVIISDDFGLNLNYLQNGLILIASWLISICGFIPVLKFSNLVEKQEKIELLEMVDDIKNCKKTCDPFNSCKCRKIV
jgi:hypothetical protein